MFSVVDPQRGSCSCGENALICSPQRGERRLDNEINDRYNDHWLLSDMETYIRDIHRRREDEKVHIKALIFLTVLLHLNSQIEVIIGCFANL